MKKYNYIIGIDTGVNTGIAVWNKQEKRMEVVKTVAIHKAIEIVKEFVLKGSCLVRVEDARQRTWFGKAGKEKLQGAGSVKRDAKVWQDFLKDLAVDFQMVPPKNNRTKLEEKKFSAITGWKERANEHGRDAGMLCYGF